MSSPETVSLQIPYAANEKQFLFLAVQAAVRTFRSINPRCADDPLYLSSPSFIRSLFPVTDARPASHTQKPSIGLTQVHSSPSSTRAHESHDNPSRYATCSCFSSET